MVYNRQNQTMKKIFLCILAIIFAVSTQYNVTMANSDPNTPIKKNNYVIKTDMQTTDMQENARAEVHDAYYSPADDAVVVIIKIYNADPEANNRVKVTPTQNIWETLLSHAAKYTTISKVSKGRNCWGTCGEVKFDCSSDSNGKKDHCNKYEFSVKIVGID